MRKRHALVRIGGFMALVALLALAAPSLERGGLAPAAPALAQEAGNVPGNSLGNTSDSEFWREIRRGMQGQVSIPDKNAGVMIQSEGENWRAVRNGPLSTYGAWVIFGVLALLALFFALRGRITIEHGASGRYVVRFNGIERFAHWVTAVSFIVLALSGLNLLYGRYVLLPFAGPEIFATLTLWGKYAHNFVGFAFMVGLALILILWVRHNLPNKYDFIWLAKGGGLLVKGSHPPSRKFNAGQKLIFWLVIIGGGSLSASGLALMFPFQIHLFAPTFEILNLFGTDLPTQLTAMQEMQLSQLWHAVVGLVLIAVVLAHIYIGSIGMEGAFDAMGTGQVDENWAREHHSVWVEEMKKKAVAGGDD
jgi:formate dehydrogenase subunit gamma